MRKQLEVLSNEKREVSRVSSIIFLFIVFSPMHILPLSLILHYIHTARIK